MVLLMPMTCVTMTTSRQVDHLLDCLQIYIQKMDTHCWVFFYIFYWKVINNNEFWCFKEFHPLLLCLSLYKSIYLLLQAYVSCGVNVCIVFCSILLSRLLSNYGLRIVLCPKKSVFWPITEAENLCTFFKGFCNLKMLRSFLILSASVNAPINFWQLIKLTSFIYFHVYFYNWKA